MTHLSNNIRVNLLAIAGSPRRGGNTDRLLNEAVAGAASQGANIKQIILSDLDIAPCQHCDNCLQTGGICSISDDMEWIYRDLRSFDRFILVSPVFFMGIPAHTKAMIDRCQALWVIKYILKLPVSNVRSNDRKGIFISTGGTNYKNLFSGSVATVKSWFITLDIDYFGELLVPGVDGFNAIKSRPDALKNAYLLGQKLVNN